MSDYNDEMRVYRAELKRLLAGRDLSPDTRARCLASLIDAGTFEEAAHKIHIASQTLLHDTMPLVMSTADGLGEKADNLAQAIASMPGY